MNEPQQTCKEVRALHKAKQLLVGALSKLDESGVNDDVTKALIIVNVVFSSVERGSGMTINDVFSLATSIFQDACMEDNVEV